MKKLFVTLLFIPVLSLAQIKEDIKALEKRSQQLKSTPKDPTFMIDGIIVEKKTAIKLNLDLIQNIVIIKDDPKYPDGLIKITNKK